MQYGGETDQFNIGHKTLSRLYTLYGIFIHIEPDELQSVDKLPL